MPVLPICQCTQPSFQPSDSIKELLPLGKASTSRGTERLMAVHSPALRPVTVVPVDTLALEPSGPLRGLLAEPFVGRMGELGTRLG